MTPIVNFKWSGPPLIKKVLLVIKLKRFFEKEKFDIVQTHFQEAEIHAALALKLSRWKPFFIGTRRNLYHWIDNESLNFYLLKKVSAWTDYILANSYKVKELCQEKENIPEKKISVIQNGVEVERYNKIKPEEAKKKIGIDAKYTVIGVVANWRPIKGLVPFLMAAKIVSEKYPEAYFVLAGSGPQKNELINFSQDLGIHKKIRLLENYPDIPAVIKTFDIAVQPSLSESFSNVLIEYMAAAKPIVATNVGDSEIVIKNGKEGILVHPNSPQELGTAILHLFNKSVDTAQMGLNAKEKVSANWSSEKILGKYKDFYSKILQ